MADVVVRAPGRVNLIGEHIDYCGGAVPPLALPLGVTGRDVEHLVELEEEELGALQLPSPLDRRVEHVVGEHLRTRRAARALETGDAVLFGEMLDASHASLMTSFEVSCPELDVLVEAACAVLGVYGSRMTGGGFGGCTVSAVRPDAAKALLAALRPHTCWVLRAGS